MFPNITCAQSGVCVFKYDKSKTSRFVCFAIKHYFPIYNFTESRKVIPKLLCYTDWTIRKKKLKPSSQRENQSENKTYDLLSHSGDHRQKFYYMHFHPSYFVLVQKTDASVDQTGDLISAFLFFPQLLGYLLNQAYLLCSFQIVELRVLLRPRIKKKVNGYNTIIEKYWNPNILPFCRL